MSARCDAEASMNALREEFPMENDTVGADLRDLRKSVDQKFEKLEAKLDVRAEKQDARLATALEQLSAKFKTQDERFERQDTKQMILLEKIDARFERQDERFERRDAKLQASVDARLEALSTRQFAVWLALITAGTTIAATVLTIMFGSPHGH
jgi:uncharacterized membrane protein YccC